MSLIYSAQVGTNADVFPDILKLYVPEGSRVIDVTYGKGVFWKKVDTGKYRLVTSDLKDGADFRKLPYADNSFDVLVIDPPYMHTPGGSAHKGHQNYEEYYRNNKASVDPRFKYHDAVLRLYMEGIVEARRVLGDRGKIIIKCQDQVCAGQMRTTSAELIHYLVGTGWNILDLVVVVSRNKPGISRLNGKQKHSRRNHSYFLVAENKISPKMGTRLSQDIWPEIQACDE